MKKESLVLNELSRLARAGEEYESENVQELCEQLGGLSREQYQKLQATHGNSSLAGYDNPFFD